MQSEGTYVEKLITSNKQREAIGLIIRGNYSKDHLTFIYPQNAQNLSGRTKTISTRLKLRRHRFNFHLGL